MTTDRILDKLDTLATSSLEIRDVRFALKYWNDASQKLRRNVLTWFKAQQRIPAALQTELVDLSDRAVHVIADLNPDVQHLVLSDRAFKDDRPVLLSKARGYSHIHEDLWKLLTRAAKAGELRPVVARALAKHKDCPETFLKAAGITPVSAERARRLDAVTGRAARAVAGKPARAVRRAADVEQKSDADFELPEEESVKTPRARRPRAPRPATGSVAAQVQKTFPKAQERVIDTSKISQTARAVRRPRT